MNKNQRIGDTLSKLSEAFKDVAFNMELLKSILLEKDSVTAPNPYPVGSELYNDYDKKFSPPWKLETPKAKPLSDDAGFGNWGQAYADSNKVANDKKIAGSAGADDDLEESWWE